MKNKDKRTEKNRNKYRGGKRGKKIETEDEKGRLMEDGRRDDQNYRRKKINEIEVKPSKKIKIKMDKKKEIKER